MQYECKITVIDTKVFPDLQEKYLADPKSGKCPFFNVGDTFVLKRTAEQDDFYHLMNGKFCGEAWDAVSRYVYSALQGGSIMRKWTNDDRMMIACCNDGTRPVIFKIERIDIPVKNVVCRKFSRYKDIVSVAVADLFPTSEPFVRESYQIFRAAIRA